MKFHERSAKATLFVLSLLLSTSVCAQVPPKSITVQTKDGEFLFTELDFTDLLDGSWGMNSGVIRNSTERNWGSVRFKLVAFDELGKPIANDSSGILDIDRLLKGRETRFSTLATFRNWSTHTRPTKLDLIFQDGTILYDYRFRLRESRSNDLTYQDALVSFVFAISDQSLSFTLTNRSNDVIELNWDRVALVDGAGQTHKVMHQGIKFADRNGPMTPSVIPSKAKLTDEFLSSERVSWERSDWLIEPFLPQGDAALKMKGKTFSLFVPLQMGRLQKNYSFNFEIVDIQ